MVVSVSKTANKVLSCLLFKDVKQMVTESMYSIFVCEILPYFVEHFLLQSSYSVVFLSSNIVETLCEILRRTDDKLETLLKEPCKMLDIFWRIEQVRNIAENPKSAYLC